MRFLPILACALFAFPVAATTTAPVPAAPDPAKASQVVNQVCAACHGADGNSPAPANPSLAGQHAPYLTKQLADFKSGARKSAVMAGMVASLTPEDMKNIGAYFAGKAAKPGAAKNKDLIALGERIYRGGNQSSGVPACAACHSPNGAGIPAQFPRLASQHADYIAAQMNLFRTGERENDAAKMMQVIAAKMTDREIKAVSDYISGLR